MKSAALRHVEDEPVHESRWRVGNEEMEARPRALGKGLVAGLVGGLIGTIVMTEFQKAWTRTAEAMKHGDHARKEQQQGENATMKAAGKIAHIGGRELSYEERKKAGPVVHYSFGTLQGAMYGAMTELTRTPGGFLPGLLFGAALFGLADEVAVPALGLSGKPNESPLSTHLYAAAAHCVYGMATEFARRGLRAAI